ncbi:hypothetical protein CB452P1_000072 [Clostridium phage CB452P1]|nr:hypothetical protein CB452P1_000072 [Clostridium phage CB452P1]
MTDKQLERANYLKKKIKELDDFIWHAEKIWDGKIINQTQKYIFKTIPCGMFEEREYILNTDIKDKLLNVLRENLKEMKEELENI